MHTYHNVHIKNLKFGRFFSFPYHDRNYKTLVGHYQFIYMTNAWFEKEVDFPECGIKTETIQNLRDIRYLSKHTTQICCIALIIKKKIRMIRII